MDRGAVGIMSFLVGGLLCAEDGGFHHVGQGGRERLPKRLLQVCRQGATDVRICQGGDHRGLEGVQHGVSFRGMPIGYSRESGG